MSELRNAVVTGANGLIGRTLVDLLIDSGVNTVAIDKGQPVTKAAESVVLDLCRSSDISPWIDSETTLFHLAASANVRMSVEDPRYDFDNTLTAFIGVLECARRANAQVIFPSTASVFDPDAPLPLTERAAKLPSSPYAAAKLAGEGYCFAYHRSYGLDVRIARMFSVYGPGMTRLAIHDIVRKLHLNSKKVEILGDGTQIRDYLHARDAARGLIRVACCGAAGEDYNLASGIPVTLLELTGMIAQLMGCGDVSITPTGTVFAGDTARWYASIAKIRAIGFEPSISLRAGLKETIDSLLSSGVIA